MRYIDVRDFKPSDSWLAKAAKATQDLEACGTADEKLKYIDSHGQVWRDLRAELLATFGNRCWFTDAEEVVAHLDVEHFRPKAKSVEEDGTIHEGYWWLAFNYQNLRLAGQIPNRQYKKCYFPLATNSFRASSDDRRWQEEIPIFLDPIRMTDVELVAYNETGAMCPSESAETVEQKRRVTLTNDLLGLSIHEPLLEARKTMWQKARRTVEQIIQLKREDAEHGTDTARTRGERERLMEYLKDLTSSRTPLSSVAKSCLIASGYSWATKLIANS